MSVSPRAAQILLVGQKIRQIRKSRRLTQADLAARIGVTQSDLSRMENGEYKVGLDTLFKILQVFELSMSGFFEEPASDASFVEDVASGETADLPEQEQILRDLASLSDETRHEVREFIAFKKMQADAKRLHWEAAQEDEPPAPAPAPAFGARPSLREVRCPREDGEDGSLD